MSDQILPPPTIGRDVLYVLGDGSKNKGAIRPAKLSVIHPAEDGKPQLVNLTVFVGTEFDFPAQAAHPTLTAPLIMGVAMDQDGKSPGTWHWDDIAIRVNYATDDRTAKFRESSESIAELTNEESDDVTDATEPPKRKPGRPAKASMETAGV